jgi:hypothetical protein
LLVRIVNYPIGSVSESLGLILNDDVKLKLE